MLICLCRTTIPGAIDVVFCSDQSADSWIVREVETIKREGKIPHVRLWPQSFDVTYPLLSVLNWKYKCCHEACLDI
jgi:hypothetical protein